MTAKKKKRKNSINYFWLITLIIFALAFVGYNFAKLYLSQ